MLKIKIPTTNRSATLSHTGKHYIVGISAASNLAVPPAQLFLVKNDKLHCIHDGEGFQLCSNHRWDLRRQESNLYVGFKENRFRLNGEKLIPVTAEEFPRESDTDWGKTVSPSFVIQWAANVHSDLSGLFLYLPHKEKELKSIKNSFVIYNRHTQEIRTIACDIYPFYPASHIFIASDEMTFASLFIEKETTLLICDLL